MYITGYQNKPIFVRSWVPKNPKACLLVVHGFKDHSERYECLGKWFCQNGVAVYGIDLRAHGRTSGHEDQFGLIERPDGWGMMRRDVGLVIEHILSQHKGLSLFLLGHSMGSLLVRDFVLHHPDSVSAIILSGTTVQPKLSMYAGMFITWWIGLTHSPDHKSAFLEKLVYGPYQKTVKGKGDKREWLSRDVERVDWIRNDPFSKGRLSIGFYREFFRSVLRINKQEQSHALPGEENASALPVYIYCGDRDPVGANGKHPARLAQFFRNRGFDEVELKVYEEARHELHNEINREDVFSDIFSWMNRMTFTDKKD